MIDLIANSSDESIDNGNLSELVDLNRITSEAERVLVGDLDGIINSLDRETDIVDEPGGLILVEPTLIRLEAENSTEITTYRLEDNAIASGEQLLGLIGGEENEVGTALFNFTGVPGNYNVKVGTYDENDGEATIALTQNDNSVGSVVLDRDLGSAIVSNETRVTKEIANNISIEQGDRFTVTGTEDGAEHVRFDFIEFEPVITPVTVPVRFEAEDANNIDDYDLERNLYASGGEVLSLKGDGANEVGEASFTFSEDGVYDISFGTFDENDGTASFTLELNGSQIGETILLDEDLGRNLADASTAVRKEIASGISLEAGDTLTIVGMEESGEFARLDYLEFVPEGSSEYQTPNLPMRMQAEDADSLTGYQVEQIGSASGDAVLSLKGGEIGELGSASFTLDMEGTYDITLGTFDENDGMSEITLELNGSQIGNTIVLDDDLGRNLGDSTTAIREEIASGISLGAGDVLTVKGLEDGGEFARLDYLEFVATDVANNFNDFPD